ncbi:MAG: bifunctional folylpolyglutamate synthase/dihydrofolate synthase [Ruminococcaceae bacterium]|nr:bifunctional folylpolyglutamate synthase/dihydrofolate synthase [Oscillospiraceae bacterium]
MKNNDFKTYANSFQAVTVPGLERIALLLQKLGNPEKKLKFIHIAGTNGKGSVSSNMACILEDAGFKVGKYISPNLIKVNERISISGEDIPDDELSDILGIIEPLSKEVEDELSLAPTQFEIWTAAAFCYFERKKCDIVVLEVGLGGEFDATNVIEGNEIAIITRLGIDHTGYLGNTIAEIASAKAGIIKEACKTSKVITVKQTDDALAVIEAEASKKGSTVIVANPTPSRINGIHEVFEIDGILDIECGISGYHQIENASLAVLAARELGIDESYIKSGIARAKNPARFELIRENPTVIYDGGHNENGIEALVASVRRYFGDVPKTVIFACMRDKEIEQSLKMLSYSDTDFLYTTVKNNPRASGAEELYKRASKLGYDGKFYESIKDAYDEAISLGKLTIVCGSLYLYKDFTEECLSDFEN